MASYPNSIRGIALVITLLAMSLFSALGLALTLSSAFARLASANHDEAVCLLNMADAALELAARDLAVADDWDAVLEGSWRSLLVDGSPDGVRTPGPGVMIDLTRETSQLSCSLPTDCTDTSIRQSTAERPWGANNPRWRPFLHSLLDGATDPRHPTPTYVVVWLGDDASEVDSNPLLDGGGPAQEGRYIVRARAEAFGPRGARRAIEADLARICTPAETGESCLPGIRVQSWRVVTSAVP